MTILFVFENQKFASRCRIASGVYGPFQVRKLGANFATKFASTFQCLNFVCKQMFTLNNNNQFNKIQTFLVAHWTRISIELLISTWTVNICLQYYWNVLPNFVAKFTPNFRTWKRNWQVCNELGNRALKSDEIDNNVVINSVFFIWSLAKISGRISILYQHSIIFNQLSQQPGFKP